MTRGVCGVLIAVPETAWAKGSPVKEAVSTAADLRAFLQDRFDDARIELVVPGPGRPVTRAAVLAAVEAARPAAGDLFVVRFFGHGLPADDKHPYQSWALTTEELTDFDLARQLDPLPGGVDTVVISNCCYGRGFLHVGPRAPALGTGAGPAHVLRQLSRAFVTNLQSVGDAPMVCISAAGNGRENGGGAVLRSVATQLVDEIKAAAERGESYRALAERFGRRRAAGREFYVDARPAERLDQVVLGTEVLRGARDDGAASCGPTMTSSRQLGGVGDHARSRKPTPRRTLT